MVRSFPTGLNGCVQIICILFHLVSSVSWTKLASSVKTFKRFLFSLFLDSLNDINETGDRIQVKSSSDSLHAWTSIEALDSFSISNWRIWLAFSSFYLKIYSNFYFSKLKINIFTSIITVCFVFTSFEPIHFLPWIRFSALKTFHKSETINFIVNVSTWLTYIILAAHCYNSFEF